MKTRIGIVGGGFSGTMIVRHLVSQKDTSFKITLFNSVNQVARGMAYSPKSESLLLNVVASKMSAFHDDPNHFLNWCATSGRYKDLSIEQLGNSFLPRVVYGRYLGELWDETIQIARKNGHQIAVIPKYLDRIDSIDNEFKMHWFSQSILVDYLILATGNQLPGNPKINNSFFYKSDFYQKNPWDIKFERLTSNLPILILGNGLTMVDTVVELREKGFKQLIYSVSPNGFNILPHRAQVAKLNIELFDVSGDFHLLDLIKVFKKNLSLIKSSGGSFDSLVDALRPKTQEIWQRLSLEDKRYFLKKLRHLWGVARHRIPLESYRFIESERKNGGLKMLAGNVHELRLINGIVEAEIFNRKRKIIEKNLFSCVINCTGPETKIDAQGVGLLHQMKKDGLISQDELQLGLLVNDQFQIINSKNDHVLNMFAIGNLLKGKLWESTAINELREQAFQISSQIIKQVSKS